MPIYTCSVAAVRRELHAVAVCYRKYRHDGWTPNPYASLAKFR